MLNRSSRSSSTDGLGVIQSKSTTESDRNSTSCESMGICSDWAIGLGLLRADCQSQDSWSSWAGDSGSATRSDVGDGDGVGHGGDCVCGDHFMNLLDCNFSSLFSWWMVRPCKDLGTVTLAWRWGCTESFLRASSRVCVYNAVPGWTE